MQEATTQRLTPVLDALALGILFVMLRLALSEGGLIAFLVIGAGLFALSLWASSAVADSRYAPVMRAVVKMAPPAGMVALLSGTGWPLWAWLLVAISAAVIAAFVPWLIGRYRGTGDR
jgi:Na+/phosphate symporter